MQKPPPPVPQLISFIIPLYNEANNIQPLYTRLIAVMNTMPYRWEIICINDGSKDDTLSYLLALHHADQRVQVIDLSRNFGKEAALTAGIDAAQGDAVIPIDADLQDPPELIPELIQHWQNGYDIVNAVREVREGESWLKKITAQLFYRVINKMTDVSIPHDTGDFRLLSRPVINALRQLPERRRFMKGLFAWVGFKTANIYYKRAPRHLGKSAWNYWKLWNFALEGITSFSQLPLQISSYLGLITASISLIYGIFILVRTLFFGNPVAGYPSLLVSLLFLGGVQLIVLGIIGEYLGRIYDESKQRPIYLIRDAWPREASGKRSKVNN